MNNILEVFSTFFRLGIISFGGPAAHIAIIEKELVVKRQWLNREKYIEYIGLSNLIPGPNSTEVAMHCGYSRAGFLGLFAAGIGFILPACTLTLALAYFYSKYHSLPFLAPLFFGIKPTVIAIILDAVIKFSKKTVKNIPLAIIGLGSLVAAILNVNELFLLLSAGVAGILWFSNGFSKSKKMILGLPLIGTSALVNHFSNAKLFFVFLKIGAILFGSGYVLFGYLDHDIVKNFGWLSSNQLMDAVAAGQFTPGSVLSTATFIGYQLSGFSGAGLATAGIFLPSFIFVIISVTIVSRLAKSNLLSYFLSAVNVASIAIMAEVVISMGRTVITDWKPALIAVIALVTVFSFPKLNTFWIILGGAGLGYLLSLF